MFDFSFRFHSLLLLAALAAAPSGEAQESNVSIWLAGGLLGRQDPFYEKLVKSDTGECAGRSYLGGMAPLGDYLDTRPRNTYVLLTANNFPKDVTLEGPREFWTGLANLKADVVALGQDDFLRAMIPAQFDQPGSQNASEERPGFTQAWAARLEKWASTRHFLASNAALRKRRKGMNQVHHRNYFLNNISADESQPWTTTSLSIDVPPGDRPTLSITDQDTNCVPSAPGKPENPKLDTFTCSVHLQPDKRYEVKKGDEVLFQFTTDAVLTPWANTAGLSQLPAALLTGKGTSLLVMAMVDPSARSLLGADHWKFKDSSGSGAETELVFLPPKDVAAAIFAVADASSLSALPVLLGDLSDAESLKLTSANRRWRVVAFYPETKMLGRTSADDVCKTYNSYSRINSEQGYDSQAWVRPEWIGETLIKVAGAVREGAMPSFRTLDVSSDDIQGDQRPAGQTRADGKVGYPSYVKRASLDPYEDEWTEQSWWNTQGGVALRLMEAMSSELSAEIAIVDENMIDQDVTDSMSVRKLLLTRKELAEVLWRHDVYVKAPRLGSELVAMLQSIAALPVTDGSGFCVLGVEQRKLGRKKDTPLGCGIPATLDPMQVRVNGKFLDLNRHYWVAMPQSLAETLKVNVPFKNHGIDVLRHFDRYLMKHKPLSKPGESSSAERSSPEPSPAMPSSGPSEIASPPLPEAPQYRPPASASAKPYAWRWHGILQAPPIAVEFYRQTYHVPIPGKDPSSFTLIPSAGEQVQHQLKFTLAGEVHFIPVELLGITLDLVSKVNLSRTDTVDDTDTRILNRTLSPDRWTNGGSITSSGMTNSLTSRLERVARFPIRLEPYVGAFQESSFFHVHYIYKTTRTTQACPNGTDQQCNLYVTEDDRKPDYRFLEGGLRFGDLKKKLGSNSLTIKGGSYAFDLGRNYAAISGVRVASREFPIEQVRFCSFKDLLGNKCPVPGSSDKFNVDPLPDNSRIDLVYFHRPETRHQLTGGIQFLNGTETTTQKSISLDVVWRRWIRSGDEFFEPLWSQEFNLKSAVPLGRTGISVGPYARLLRVRVVGQPGIFSTMKVGFTANFSFTCKLGAGTTCY
jgi:hypothetical protein